MRRLILAIAFLLGLVPATVAARELPRLTILEPVAGATLSGTTVTLRVETAFFENLAESSAVSAGPNAGHLFAMLNGGELRMVGSDGVLVFENVQPGRQRLHVFMTFDEPSAFSGDDSQVVEFNTTTAPLKGQLAPVELDQPPATAADGAALPVRLPATSTVATDPLALLWLLPLLLLGGMAIWLAGRVYHHGDQLVAAFRSVRTSHSTHQRGR